MPTPRTEPKNQPWSRLNLPALAYRVGGYSTVATAAEGTWLAGRGQPPRQVGRGFGQTPVWSSENRYLAWGDDPPPVQASRLANAPNHDEVTVLDTHTGEERTVPHDPHAALDGQVLAIPGGFAAVVSGRNNLGNGATDLLLIDLRHGLAGVTTRRLHTGLPGQNGTLWTQSLGYELIAVSTEASVLHYRYQPIAYAVTLDGRARELFRSPTNIGFPGLSISPDGGLAAGFIGGSGGGGDCLNDSRLAVGNMNTGPGDRPAGLPLLPADASRQEYGDLSWTATGDLLLALGEHVLSTPFGTLPAHCQSQNQNFQLYRCPAGRNCVPLPLTPLATRGVGPALDVHSGRYLNMLSQSPDGTLALAQYAVSENDTPEIIVVPANCPATRLTNASDPAWSN